MNDIVCRHTRTQLIAKDKDAEYVECLDCGEILEAGERTNQNNSSAPADASSDNSADTPAADGSLSDA